jgi:hypothetical protein
MSREIEAPEPVAAEDSKAVEVSASVTDSSTDELFRWLGRRDAFSLMAGRCSAADAECIKRLRDTKLYLKRAKDWEQFCDKFLHMSKSKANFLLRLLDEFGPAYFYIAQVTRIGVKEYRACIAPAVSERRLECGGEAIEIVPENSERIAQAVATLQAKATACEAPAEAEPEKPIADQVAAHIERVRGELEELRHLRYRNGGPHSGLTVAVNSLFAEIGKLLVDVR